VSDNISLPAPAPPIGVRIRSLRKTRGWSLAELARRAGTSAPSLHRYESGWDRFEVATLRRIAAALGARLEVRLVCEGSCVADPEEIGPRKLAALLAPLFWDRKLTVSDLRDHPQWVLRRVLMFGGRRQAGAVRDFYGDEAVREAVAHRSVDARTRNYWQVLLEGAPDAS